MLPQKKRGPGRPAKVREPIAPEVEAAKQAQQEKFASARANKQIVPIDHEGRERFALEYYSTPNVADAAHRAGITPAAAKNYVNAAWFDKRLDEIRKAADKKMDRRLTSLIDKTIEALNDRIDNGDFKLISPGKKATVGRPKKDDPDRVTKDEVEPPQLVRVPLSAQALTILTGVLFDKRTGLRKVDNGDEKAPEDAVNRLAERLREFARPAAPQAGEIIDVQHTEVKKP